MKLKSFLLIVVSFLALSLAFSSCSNDSEDEREAIERQIVGGWAWTQKIFGKDNGAVFEFKEDHTAIFAGIFVSALDYFSGEGRWELLEDDKTVYIYSREGPQVFTYDAAKKTLIWKSEHFGDVYLEKQQ